ncbi:hypothetical protein EI94DRAFT_1855748 [Lactarius quietus]|nr:hypothetical protein EI94DRAFT_1855748 [Lactarius quietus]
MAPPMSLYQALVTLPPSPQKPSRAQKITAFTNQVTITMPIRRDLNDNEQVLELALKNPTRFSDVMATEQPTWLSGEVAESPATLLTLASSLNEVTSCQSQWLGILSWSRWSVSPVPPKSLPQERGITHLVAPTLHINTDLVFLEGLQIMLTHQHPIIHCMVQDAITNFKPLYCLHLPKDALAWLLSRVTNLVQLLFNPNSKTMTTILPNWFPCSGGSSSDWQTIEQLHLYFPEGAPVIRELYFTGGTMSFASWFSHMFPVHFGDNGSPSWEVPIPMVALVATVLYTMFYEWHTGEQQAHKFSTNAYMNMYCCVIT